MATAQIIPTSVDPDEFLIKSGMAVVSTITVVHALRFVGGEDIKTARGEYMGTELAVGA